VEFLKKYNVRPFAGLLYALLKMVFSISQQTEGFLSFVSRNRDIPPHCSNKKLDVSRTVGWFAIAIYKYFKYDPKKDTQSTLVELNNMAEDFSNAAMDWSVLKCLVPGANEILNQIQGDQSCFIRFNYAKQPNFKLENFVHNQGPIMEKELLDFDERGYTSDLIKPTGYLMILIYENQTHQNMSWTIYWIYNDKFYSKKLISELAHRFSNEVHSLHTKSSL